MFYDDAKVDTWMLYAKRMWRADDLPDMNTQLEAWREIGGAKKDIPRKMYDSLARKEWALTQPILTSPSNYWHYCSPQKLWTGYAIWNSLKDTPMAREFANGDHAIAGINPFDAFGAPFWCTTAPLVTETEREASDDIDSSLMPCQVLRKYTLRRALKYANRDDRLAWRTTQRVTWHFVAQILHCLPLVSDKDEYQISRGGLSCESWNTPLHTFIRSGVVNDVPVYSSFAHEDYEDQAMSSLQPKHVQTFYRTLLANEPRRLEGKKRIVVPATLYGVANGGRFRTALKGVSIILHVDGTSVTGLSVQRSSNPA
jgi:hypothetical protein